MITDRNQNLAEQLKKLSKQNRNKLREVLGYFVNNGHERVQNFCCEMRLDIHLETEIINEKIQESSRELLQKMSSSGGDFFDLRTEMRIKNNIDRSNELKNHQDDLIRKIDDFERDCTGKLGILF